MGDPSPERLRDSHIKKKLVDQVSSDVCHSLCLGVACIENPTLFSSIFGNRAKCVCESGSRNGEGGAKRRVGYSRQGFPPSDSACGRATALSHGQIRAPVLWHLLIPNAGRDPNSRSSARRAPTGMLVTAQRERRIRAWVAVFASYLTLFTAVFGGLSPSSAAARTVDPALVICAHDATSHPLDQAPAHHHDDGCCLAGCCMVAADALPGTIAIPVLSGRVVAVLAPLPTGTGLDRRPSASPRRTRGPPPSV